VAKATTYQDSETEAKAGGLKTAATNSKTTPNSTTKTHRDAKVGARLRPAPTESRR
jgi:hypothetical protein